MLDRHLTVPWGCFLTLSFQTVFFWFVFCFNFFSSPKREATRWRIILKNKYLLLLIALLRDVVVHGTGLMF